MSLGSSSAAFFGAAGAAGAAAGYEIERSLRFNPSDSASLTRAFSASGGRYNYTFSFWLKKNNSSAVYQNILIDNSSTSNQIRINDTTAGFELRFAAVGASAVLTTNRKFRDPSGWYHIVCAYDSLNATSSDRMRIYVNGVRETSFLGETQPTLGLISSFFSSGSTYTIGYYNSNTAIDGYLADVQFIDGKALEPTDFGEFDVTTGVWQPIEYTSTFAAPVTQTPALDGAMIIKADGAQIIGGAAGSGLKCLYTSSNGIDWTFQNREAVGPFQTDAKYLAIGASGTNDITFIPGNGESFTYAMYSATTDFTTQSDITVDTTSLSYSAGGTTSYGTVGFHLPFSDNSSASALGTDTSGNGNDWTVNNISAPVTDITLRPRSTTTWTATGGMATHSYFQSPANKTDSNFGYNATLNWNTSGVTTGGTMQLDFATVLATAGDVVDVFQGNPTFETPKLILDNSADLFPDSSTTSSDTNFKYSTFTIPAGRTCSIVFTTTTSGARSSFFGVMVNGISILTDDINVDNDSLRDSPTNGDTANDTGAGGEVPGNYCTLNPLATQSGGSATLSEGNLKVTLGATRTSVFGTYALIGKTYWEAVFTGGAYIVGMAEASEFNTTANTSPNRFIGDSSDGWSIGDDGTVYNGGSVGSETSWTNGDVIGWSYDSSNGSIKIYKNGTLNGSYTADVTKTFFPAATLFYTSSYIDFNFGQRAFAYSAPSGYKALCTANLDDPTIADGSTAMDVGLYTGTGSSSAIAVNGVADPDFVWIKSRSAASSHALYDVIRGWNERLYSNSDIAEYTYGSDILAPTSTGLNITTTDADHNTSSATYVAWTWDGGSSTAANTDGSISSSVRANASAGFSIVSYSGNGTAGATIGHGLGVAPQFIITKRRNSAANWQVGHQGIGWTHRIYLDATNAASATIAAWNDTAPTSTVFTAGSSSSVNASGSTYIAYCWAPVEGYSAFGSYTGNGSSDGPFVYTGFRPRWILIKNYSPGGQNWILHDTTRNEYNVADLQLLPSAANAEYQFAGNAKDILSNGFKLRGTNGGTNASGELYIYAAFAENPFKYARAR